MKIWGKQFNILKEELKVRIDIYANHTCTECAIDQFVNDLFDNRYLVQSESTLIYGCDSSLNTTSPIAFWYLPGTYTGEVIGNALVSVMDRAGITENVSFQSFMLSGHSDLRSSRQDMLLLMVLATMMYALSMSRIFSHAGILYITLRTTKYCKCLMIFLATSDNIATNYSCFPHGLACSVTALLSQATAATRSPSHPTWFW